LCHARDGGVFVWRNLLLHSGFRQIAMRLSWVVPNAMPADRLLAETACRANGSNGGYRPLHPSTGLLFKK